MKSALLLASTSIVFFASCSSGNKLQSSLNNDDLYTAKTESYVSAPEEVYSDGGTTTYNDGQTNPDPDYTTSEKYTDENGTSYITNNYYEGQNYDFYGNESGYSTDLSHWYGPSLGFSYFSPFYSMGMYGASWSIGFGWGNSWYNPYYYSYYPYYPWYSPYGSCYYPYYYPYWSGYYGGGYCGGGYYGDGYYYGGNTYYGSHGSSSSNTSADGSGRRYKSAGEESVMNEGDGRVINNSNLNTTQSSQNPINTKSGIITPVETSGSADVKDIKRNTTIVSGTLSETGNVKSTTDKDLFINGKSNEIKSVVPPAHSASPSNTPVRQNSQDIRPRTNSAELLFQQQRASNEAINASSNIQSGSSHRIQSDNHEAVQLKSSVTSHSGIPQFSKNQSVQKMNGLETPKGTALGTERSSKSSQHIKINSATVRHSQNNGSNTGRSYTQQHSNTSNFSSGSNRSTGSAFHRK